MNHVELIDPNYEILFDLTYPIDYIRVMRGDILSPNRTGHECIVCYPIGVNDDLNTVLNHHFKTKYPDFSEVYRFTSIGKPNDMNKLGTVKFQAINYNGFDYNIAAMFIGENADSDAMRIDFDATKEAFKSVFCAANSLPGRTLTTVRIPYGMEMGLGCTEWEKIYWIIVENLVKKKIPVEVWYQSKG